MKAVELYADEELVEAIRQNQNLNKAISFIYQQHAEKISSFLIKLLVFILSIISLGKVLT